MGRMKDLMMDLMEQYYDKHGKEPTPEQLDALYEDYIAAMEYQAELAAEMAAEAEIENE